MGGEDLPAYRGRTIKQLVALSAVIATAAALALTMVSSGQAGKGDIYGTDHDVGSAGNPTCAQCHLPHNAEAMYLWARVPYSGPDSYAGESEVLPLCFSCHDGSIAADGAYFVNADNNHRQGVVQYDPDHVPDSGDEYPITEHARYETTCKKCMEPDCVKCHDAHDNAWVFLDSNRFGPMDYNKDGTADEEFVNASICAWCHNGSSHGVESYDGANRIPHTTHPEMISEPEGANDFTPPATADRRWNGDVALDLSGTRLWSDATTYVNTPGQEDTARYVNFTGAGDVRCMTCHTAHAAQNEELNSMAASTEVDSSAPICTNCHP